MDDCGMTVDEGTVILRFFTISSMMERTPNLSGNGSGLVGTTAIPVNDGCQIQEAVLDGDIGDVD